MIRISFAVLANLQKSEQPNRCTFTDEMIGVDLHRTIASLTSATSRPIKDPDAVKDIRSVQEKIMDRLNALSSFDMYLTELRAGSLKKVS